MLVSLLAPSTSALPLFCIHSRIRVLILPSIANEQEHFRQGPPPANLTAAISSNIDDVTMHELYLWPFADAVKAGTGSSKSS